MSSLLLIRHAQASLFEADYDQLSERGEKQALKLGEYLTSQNLTFDEVYIGPRERHRRTAEIAAQCYRAADRQWPDMVTLEELDEHHVDRILAREDGLADRIPGTKKLVESFADASEPADRQKRFQLLFEAVARLWVAGDLDFGIETWAEFKTRVNAGIDRITRGQSRSRRIAVITSVGPLTVALQRALGYSDEVALVTGWRIWNCSLTGCVFTGNRFTLDSFNSLPHLPDRREWTYR